MFNRCAGRLVSLAQFWVSYDVIHSWFNNYLVCQSLRVCGDCDGGKDDVGTIERGFRQRWQGARTKKKQFLPDDWRRWSHALSAPINRFCCCLLRDSRRLLLITSWWLSLRCRTASTALPRRRLLLSMHSRAELRSAKTFRSALV